MKVSELCAGGLERTWSRPRTSARSSRWPAAATWAADTPSDFTGDIHRYTVGLAEGIEKDGVRFSETPRRASRIGNEMTGPKGFGYGVDVRLDNYESEMFDGVVVCAGVQSRNVAAQLGDRVGEPSPPPSPLTRALTLTALTLSFSHCTRNLTLTLAVVLTARRSTSIRSKVLITVNLKDEKSQKAAPWVSLLDDKAKIVAMGVDRSASPVPPNSTATTATSGRTVSTARPMVQRHFPTSPRRSVPWLGCAR